MHNIAMRRFEFPLLLLFSLACVPAQGPSQALELLRQGEAQLNMHNYREAADRFEQSYNWQPAFQAAFQAGYCHFELKRFAEAELWLEKARKLNPESEGATVYLASAQIANYKPGPAIRLLEEFARRHPDARQVSATLAAIRSDLSPQKRPARSVSFSQFLLAGLLVLSFLLFIASLRATNAGIREGGRGLGLVALASFYLISPFPALPGWAGYAWAGFKLYRGYHLYRFLKREGSWAALMRSELYRFAAAFIGPARCRDEARVGKALNGLLRAGLSRDSVREVEIQLQTTQADPQEIEQTLEQFGQADRLIQEMLLRLLAGMALQLGYAETEKRLLRSLAAKLRLEHRLADLLVELGAGGADSSGARPAWGAEDTDPLAPYFQILDVAPSASRSQVKSGYRRQVKRYHPDVISHLGGEFSTGAADRFRTIKQAYQKVCKARGWDE
ncbi:MAG: DnaJ domain-containing protein [Acidobacteria bacterium]|nr:DnaJ domain-containing protein [Acidobacteriota bacterium]